MKKTALLVSLMTVIAGCNVLSGNKAVNRECEFAAPVCESNIQTLQDGITKFSANGGMYIIKDMDSGKTMDNTSIHFDADSVYYTYFHKIDFDNSATPERLLNKYINLVKSSGNGLKRQLRDNVIGGTGSTGRKADIAGVEVSGVTSTTDKMGTNNVMTAFLGHVKHNGKTYAYVFILDEPKGLKSTYGWKTAGWNVVPTARGVIENIIKE